MVTIDSGIVLDFPDVWERFSEGTRCVFHTPRREEIIVSAARVSGEGAAVERAQVIERVFANGLEAARRGMSAPDLRIIKPLAEDSGLCRFRCATVFAVTTSGDGFYAQAIIQHPYGVLFLTCEAPFVDGAEQTFCDLMRMIHES